MKDATVSARVQSDIKKEAEKILQDLGIPVSVVINSLYRQIIYRQGIPFSIAVPKKLNAVDSMTKEELDAKLQHSYDQTLNGETVDADAFFDNLEGRF